MTGTEYTQTKAYELEVLVSKLLNYAMTELTEEQSIVIYDFSLELLKLRSNLI